MKASPRDQKKGQSERKKKAVQRLLQESLPPITFLQCGAETKASCVFTRSRALMQKGLHPTRSHRHVSMELVRAAKNVIEEDEDTAELEPAAR